MTHTQPKQTELVWCDGECRNEWMRSHNGEPTCGCGQAHKMKAFGNWIIHWQGKHWLLDCLVKKLLVDRGQDRDVIALINSRMKRFQQDIAGLKCSEEGCLKVVGKRYRIIGSLVYCHQCYQNHHDIGGEG